jgi:hypothetical protein
MSFGSILIYPAVTLKPLIEDNENKSPKTFFREKAGR